MRWFVRIPWLVKLLVGCALVWFFGDLGMALRWPARIVIVLLFYFGSVQAIYGVEGRVMHGWLWGRMTWYLVVLLVFIVVSRVVKESFPLSHYPMYSNPGPERVYLYLAKEGGGEMQPLPIYDVCGITPAKLRRMYRSIRNEYFEETGEDQGVLDAAGKAVIGERVLAYLHERAAHRQKWQHERLAGEWGVVEVVVTYDEVAQKINEAESVMARRIYR